MIYIFHLFRYSIFKLSVMCPSFKDCYILTYPKGKFNPYLTYP
jgi:hypothetical protein